jgi:CubicO group peptidase (beta-lactamase class C family)
MEADQMPSVSVAVAKGGQILWEESFGWANRAKMTPATANTMYSLASISKPFTATGVMRLVDQGEIDLDKPINDYLGVGKLTGLAGDASGATVRRVLSHTSGLPLHYQFFYETNGYGPPSMDTTVARYGILVNPPGEVFQFSNLGFGILGYVAARTSGLDYPDYMRTRVFLPLGLTHISRIGPARARTQIIFMGNEGAVHSVVGRLHSRLALFDGMNRDPKGLRLLLVAATRDGDNDALRELHAIVGPSPAHPRRKDVVDVHSESRNAAP